MNFVPVILNTLAFPQDIVVVSCLTVTFPTVRVALIAVTPGKEMENIFPAIFFPCMRLCPFTMKCANIIIFFCNR